MEYQFISDPLDGVSLSINDEHENIARWLTEETSVSSNAINTLLLDIKSHIGKINEDFQIVGKERILTISDGEVAVKVIHMAVAEHELERLTQEALSCDSSCDMSECGLDDFIDLLEDWLQFLTDNNA